jgi:hypothetical protein
MKRSLCITAVLFLLALVPVTGVATDWLLPDEESGFRVDVKGGRWSDVLILADGVSDGQQRNPLENRKLNPSLWDDLHDQPKNWRSHDGD